MKSSAKTSAFIGEMQGFGIFSLENEFLRVSLVPELGAKIISLLNRRSGREWMNYPNESMKLHRNSLGDEFTSSTLVGWDECLPTIASCDWKDRHLPDHGEVWSMPWTIDQHAFGRGRLNASVNLSISPLKFKRGLFLNENEIHLNYELENLGGKPEEFLWAMHPLVSIKPGDTLELTPESLESIGNPAWIKSLAFEGGHLGCSKIFAGPIQNGRAAIKNSWSGDRLAFEWDTKINNMLGIWLTRGGWHGQHHMALEPCNGHADSIAEAKMRGHCGIIQPNSRIQWHVTIRVESQNGHQNRKPSS